MNKRITRKQLEKATNQANGFATHYKLDVLNHDAMQCLMTIVWEDMDGRTIGEFLATFAIFLGPKHIPTWFDDVVKFAENKKANYKAEKSSTGISELSDWYIIK